MSVGIIGAILVLFAWLIETRKVIKSKHVRDLDIRFLLIYLIGGILLTYHAVQINDWVFVGLSSSVSFLTLVELVFVFIRRR